MKRMKLLKLELSNFKGIKHFELDTKGNNVKIYGDNATGKTTIFDAFSWLLFGKDSRNKKDFQLKTMRDGKVIHHLKHEVEATFLIDDKTLTLKKSFFENWVKKRGSVVKEFIGHKTKHFIDGVPSKKKEFTDKVHEIIDEGIFKLLTNPSYFNEQIHWEDRRELLLEISGDITDEEIIRSNKNLSQLADILGNRSIENHKKVIAEKRKEINAELESIPVRIDEINRGLPDESGLEKAKIDRQLKEVTNEIDAKQDQINDMKSGGEISKMKAQISAIDLQIANMKNEYANQEQQEVYKLKLRLQEEQSNVRILKSKVKNHEQRKQMNQSTMKELEERIEELRHDWTEKQEESFDHEANGVCPTCGQDLPKAKQEEAINNFNRNKSKLLETIQVKGKEAKQKVKSIKEKNVGIDVKIVQLNEQIQQKQQEVEKLQNKIEQSENNVTPITKNETYNKLENDRQMLEQQIENMKQSVNEPVQEIQKEIESLKQQKSALQIDQSKLMQLAQSKHRIDELEQQEKDLAVEFEQLEQELYLAEEFIRTKVNLLEEKINSKFKHASFNLFKEHINGGIEDICETTYRGIPYRNGLNNAARINVGLDIINTLSEHYGVQVPVFIDGAESVTQLIDMDAQVISLIVSEPDKQLRVELDPKSFKKAI